MVVLTCVNNIDFDSKAMLYRNKDYLKALSKMKHMRKLLGLMVATMNGLLFLYVID